MSFHRNVIVVDVLSDHPLLDDDVMELRDLTRTVDSVGVCALITRKVNIEVTAEAMTEMLTEQGVDLAYMGLGRTTPEQVTELGDGEVFVFGSNLAGRHGAGAAAAARQFFGAEYGKGEGLTGRCYAFPTLDGSFGRRSQAELEASRDLFFETATENPDLTFLLTRVGTGIAGYPEEEMVALFRDAPRNIVKPSGW